MYSILTVDDSPVLIDFYRGILKSEFIVKAAFDAEAALVSARKEVFDLVITDGHLPGMSGLELIRTLKTMPHYDCVPMLLVSGDADCLANAKSCGADCWILKPVEPRTFLKAIPKLIERNKILSNAKAQLSVSQSNVF